MRVDDDPDGVGTVDMPRRQRWSVGDRPSHARDYRPHLGSDRVQMAQRFLAIDVFRCTCRGRNAAIQRLAKLADHVWFRTPVTAETHQCGLCVVFYCARRRSTLGRLNEQTEDSFGRLFCRDGLGASVALADRC